MITEIAHLTIDPANAEAFERAVEQAATILRAAKGSHSMALERVIEDPARYRLRVEWDRVEDHTVGFRESEGFTQWRALAGPYFVEPPYVEHTQSIGRFF